MSETKHRRIFTEGPWNYREAFDNGEPCGYVVQSGVNAIADVPQGEDDARLISSAPDLLEALEEMVAEAKERNRAAGEMVFNPTALNVAQAAIAKAKGEA